MAHYAIFYIPTSPQSLVEAAIAADLAEGVGNARVRFLKQSLNDALVI